MKSKQRRTDFQYDVCLSFAGEDRAYVRAVATLLTERGIRVFYDEYEEAELWGKDLYVHLDEIYGAAARYCVLFASKHYGRKLWTNHERQSAQARAFKQHREYILPVRFDATQIPGLKDTVGHIDASRKTPEQLARLVAKKLGDRPRSNFLPPIPDRLFKDLRARSKRVQRVVYNSASSFLESLERMTPMERDLVFQIFSNGCPAELPENIHINIDLLRRLTGVAPVRIKRGLAKLSSLGFATTLREDDENPEALGRKEMLVLRWTNFAESSEDMDGCTAVADAMIRLAQDQICPSCAAAALRRLDFGQLATATAETDEHLRPPK